MKPTSLSRLTFLVLSMTLVVPLITSSLTTARAQKDDEDSLYKYLTVFTEVLRLVRSTYVTETDIRSLMAGALDGATDALDPFSTYVPEDEVETYRRVRQVGRTHSGLLVLKERGVAFVVAVDEGSPADEAGVEAGDILSEIQGLSSRAMPLWQIRGFLADEAGTQLELELLRRGNVVDVEFALGPYDLPRPSAQTVDGVTVVRLPSFSAGAAGDLDKILTGLTAERVLIDLRGVAGGEAEDAYEIAKRFTTGKLGSLVESGAVIKSYSSDGTPTIGQREIAVLVNRGSQGAAEILASILKQSGAQVFGERTFGHAGLSGWTRLTSGAYLEMTEGFFTGPDGEPLKEGIEPDKEVRVTSFGEEESKTDEVLEKTLELFLEGAGDEAALDVA